MKPGIMFFCPSFSSGGAEKVLVNLANHFHLAGYCTSFLVSQRIGNLDELLDPGIATYSLNKRLSSSLWPIYKFLKEKKPDVIICGPQFINVMTIVVCKLLLRNNTKVILTHHNFYDLDAKKVPFAELFGQSMLKHFYALSDVIVAVSHAVKKHLVSDIGIPDSKVVVIYNPVVDRNFHINKLEPVFHKWFHSDRDYKLIVSVGRLSKVKNQEELIRLMPDLIKTVNCRLILVGDGEQFHFFKALIAELALERYVDIVGAVINPLNFIYQADLLILPSITETFSLVAVESIACGTPVLSTPTAGVLEILGTCKGCFFESLTDKKKFIESIAHILSNVDLPIHKEFANRFEVANIALEYESLVRDLCVNQF